ncbi:MAG: DUF4954 family protein [Treponemataceae bacterium]|nr:DUF4954 family protein [Treponemataceae bacterium]
MPRIELVANTEEESTSALFDNIDFSKKRNPTEDEIKILEQNKNFSSDSSWKNLFVDENFDINMIKSSEFIGKIVLGKISNSCLKYHDLMLPVGIFNSTLHDCVIGDDVCIKNVAYLKNYFVESHVILFNIQEMSCTLHSKFGNGILKSGEPEENRIWIGVGNENDGRAVLPFEDMIPADAFLWSRFRGDKELMSRFIELTEYGNSGELNTFGYVGEDSVVKNCTLIKDVKIGKNAYIKGAFKLKNITVCSSYDEPSQIGEGVEMVNGILGYGSRVFYQAVAVRFVIGRNCQLKYGARLLNTILGDNSTVSCCELLNNLIFPFHEQHHNSSFLIATTLLGQSNIAAGATIGSNHNSRSPDGEIYAGRGFWPGLCSDFKHNSKFASFSLIAKGSYQNELNILYPFSLVSTDAETGGINVLPGYWFLYNMFAIARNISKFKSRDRRVVKKQHIEIDPLAPDTIQELLFALNRIIELTGRWLKSNDEYFKNVDEGLFQHAKDFLHQNPNSQIVLEDPQCMRKNGAKILKAASGYKEYRKLAKYFAAETFINFCKSLGVFKITKEGIENVLNIPLFTKWMNIGGQVIPEDKVNELFDLIKTKKINSWQEVHDFYDECQNQYDLWKVRYAIFVLEQLYSKKLTEFTSEIIRDIVNDVLNVSNYIYESSLSSREKDYSDYFRTITYSSKEEMTAVIGTINDVKFLKELEVTTKEFNESLQLLFADFM